MIDCPREQDLLDALASSRWPARCEPELRAHVESCHVCADTLAVALPLLTEAEIAYASAHVPSSGIVWWRAQLRARQEAERAASRPIAIVQAVACACALALVAAAALWVRPALPNMRDWVHDLGGSVMADATSLTNAVIVSPWGVLPWIALAMFVLLAPVAIYLAVSDE
jgi:hypothetical protein